MIDSLLDAVFAVSPTLNTKYWDGMGCRPGHDFTKGDHFQSKSDFDTFLHSHSHDIVG